MSIRDNLGGGSAGSVLDTLEEIEANTEAGKAAGALAVKELNDSLGGMSFGYDETTQKYGYWKKEADTEVFVPFKSGADKYNNVGATHAGWRRVYFNISALRPNDYNALTLDNICIQFTNINVSANGFRTLSYDYNHNNGLLYVNSSDDMFQGGATANIWISA